MPYVDVMQRSGLGQGTMLKRLTTALRTVLPKLTTITAPVGMPFRPPRFNGVIATVKPADVAAGHDVVYARLKAGLTISPSDITREFAAWVFSTYGLSDPVFHKATALLRQKLAREIPTPIGMPYRPPLVGKPAVPTAIRIKDLLIRRPPPLTYAFARGYLPPVLRKGFPGYKTESGSLIKTVQAEVVSGPDVHSPMTGQTISLRETDPIIPLSATREGLTITDETEPTVPTFVEAAAFAPSPWMKYALLAAGGYILYDSFVKSKPKRRKRRRRR